MALEISSEITNIKAIIYSREGGSRRTPPSFVMLDPTLADVEADFAEVAPLDSTGIGVFN